MSEAPPPALLSLVLHAHLPWVLHHGTWPHGTEWLHEAAAETYLPLLRTLENLERDGVPVHLTLVLSPILLEQLAHPTFLAEFPRYLDRKIAAAEEDRSYFEQSGDGHYAYLASFWRDRFLAVRDDLAHFSSDLSPSPILAGFRRFQRSGALSTITSCATHAFLPLLATDESIHAQIALAIQTHQRHLGHRPHAIWSPECGYRPAGPWQQPVADAGTFDHPAPDLPAPADRAGLETLFAQHDLHLFFADTDMVTRATSASVYQPFLLTGSTVAVFPRDPRTGTQVWSADGGYPGEPAYLDFYKKRWPGGHRYWRVTDWHTGMGEKQPYHPEAAAERIQSHAAHFVLLLRGTFAAAQLPPSPPPVLTAPYDAELFGHWWFEGPQWLEAVARNLHTATDLRLSSAVDALAQHPPSETISLPAGSWGAGGDDRVWLNPETLPLWQELYRAEHLIRDLASSSFWPGHPLATRILRQLCRELLLLQSSDWPFLITTGAARDYAEARIATHLEQFRDLTKFWTATQAGTDLAAPELARLEEIERRDNFFPDLDPAAWARHEAQGA